MDDQQFAKPLKVAIRDRDTVKSGKTSYLPRGNFFEGV